MLFHCPCQQPAALNIVFHHDRPQIRTLPLGPPHRLNAFLYKKTAAQPGFSLLLPRRFSIIYVLRVQPGGFAI